MNAASDTKPRWVDYDYAVVRVVPSVAPGVFVHVGAVLHARQARFRQVVCSETPHALVGLDALPPALLDASLRAMLASDEVLAGSVARLFDAREEP